MSASQAGRITSGTLATVLAAACFFTFVQPVAQAATGDVGHPDQTFSGVVNPPTSDKPQSKLWFNDGLWWATMFDSASVSWHIYRLDRSSQSWVDTGTQVDDRPQSLSDALWDGTKLYIGSQYVTISDDTATRPSVAQPARLYRYSYSSATKTYALDVGFPATISNGSSESLTIDKDTTGRVWATWTKVSGSSATGFSSAVYVNSSADGSTWGTPLVVPASGANPAVAPDDISALVAFGRSKVGVLWSNHLDDSVYWATHNDGDPVDTWKGGIAVRGSKKADDHLNLKTIDADAAGRVVAAVKTSLDELSTSKSTDPQINVLVFKPSTGSWSSTVFGTLADCQTRPQVMLDSTNSEVHVFATGPTQSGCPYPGSPGTIYEKTASLDDPTFPAGRGTPVIRDIASANMNNVTTTKQSVTSASGLVVLASNNVTKRYWHADEQIRGSTPAVPTASFNVSASSGAAPLVVQLADTSTNSPTSWAWDFGNGTASTAQNPSASYMAAGTYTVSLRASNAAGTSAAVTRTVTVTAPTPTPTPTPSPTSRTVTLTPVADTTAKQASSTTNYGGVTTIQADTEDVAGNTSTQIRSYLRFTVPNLAAGESITSAQLSLDATNGTTNGPVVYRTATDWDESTLTWSSGRPARSPSTAVGNYGSVPMARVSANISGITGGGDVSLELAPESSDGMTAGSREVPTAGSSPQLILTITS
jgi:PKD repeat protein